MASSPRVASRSGENVVALVPVVMPVWLIHATAVCCHGATTSVNWWAGTFVGSPARRHSMAAISPRVSDASGE